MVGPERCSVNHAAGGPNERAPVGTDHRLGIERVTEQWRGGRINEGARGLGCDGGGETLLAGSSVGCRVVEDVIVRERSHRRRPGLARLGPLRKAWERVTFV